MEEAAHNFFQGIVTIASLPTLTKFLFSQASDVVQNIKEEAKDELEKFIERERTPYTQNHYLFENLSKLRTESLMEEVLSSVHQHTDDNTSNSDLASTIQLIFERNQKRSIEEHMSEEMQNALDAYGKVAYKRFVDIVPMICVQIMQRFPKMLNDILLDVTDSQIEESVMAPSSAVKTMTALQKEVETLDTGIETVRSLSRRDI